MNFNFKFEMQQETPKTYRAYYMRIDNTAMYVYVCVCVYTSMWAFALSRKNLTVP